MHQTFDELLSILEDELDGRPFDAEIGSRLAKDLMAQFPEIAITTQRIAARMDAYAGKSKDKSTEAHRVIG